MSNVQQASDTRATRNLGMFWTAANIISLSRVVLVVPITYLILIDGPMRWIFGLIFLGMLTDFFDGRVARWSGTVSEWGKVLDPVADKLAAAAVTVALVFRSPEAGPTLPLWFLGLIIVRDGSIVLGGILIARRTGEVLMSIWWGKVAVTALSITVLAALLKADQPVMQVCIWITTVLMGYAFILYILRFLRVWRDGVSPATAGLDGEGGRTVASVQPEG